MGWIAYVDESMRQRRDGSGQYVLAATVLDEAVADELRFAVSQLRRGKRRFHWRDEEPADRHRAVRLVAELEALHVVVVGVGLDNPRQERGRRKCMARLLWDLDQAGVAHVWLDARRPNQNRRDITLVDALRTQDVLSTAIRVDFVYPTDEPLAWLPDIVAGAVSAAHGDGHDAYVTTLGGVLDCVITIALT